MVNHHNILKVNEEQLTIDKDCERRVTLSENGVIFSNPETFTLTFTSGGYLFNGTVDVIIKYWRCGLPHQYFINFPKLMIQQKVDSIAGGIFTENTLPPALRPVMGNQYKAGMVLIDENKIKHGFIIINDLGGAYFTFDDWANPEVFTPGNYHVGFENQTIIIDTGRSSV